MQMDYSPTITAEMRARYIARRESDLATLEAALEKRDFETVLKISHQIKGNAATFSFTALEKSALDLEKSAEAKNYSEAQLALGAFRSWLNSVKPA